MECEHPDGTGSSLGYEETNNWLMFSPEDARTLITACKIKGRERRYAEALYSKVLDRKR